MTWKCSRGVQLGKLFFRHVEELTEVGREYIEYQPARFEQSGSKTRLSFSSRIGSKTTIVQSSASSYPTIMVSARALQAHDAHNELVHNEIAGSRAVALTA